MKTDLNFCFPIWVLLITVLQNVFQKLTFNKSFNAASKYKKVSWAPKYNEW